MSRLPCTGARTAPIADHRCRATARWQLRLTLAVLPCALAGLPGLVQAARPMEEAPAAVFVQAGYAERAESVTLGATWDWAWQKPTGWGVWTGYWEAAAGLWHNARADGQDHSEVFAQVGITPVVRFEPEALPGLFLEGGIGANLILPRYRTRDRKFSTLFNFGDHLAVGWRFGERRQHEWALRIAHFSNADIKEPNPGEDFVQLRYVRHF
jgi:lipid A 3-O-deacylase